MILLLAGTPGVGKTTAAEFTRALLAQNGSQVTLLSTDEERARLGVAATTSGLVEDAIWWRLYQKGIDALREGHSLIIDSTGISGRLPYFRQALADYPQTFVRLRSIYDYAACTRKYGSSISQAKFTHLQSLVMSLPVDHDVVVDGKTPEDLARILAALLTG